jgi:MoxR-like ATPase
VLATENPVEFHGVFPLPEAQMDRFLVRLSIGYPTLDTELQILHEHREGTPLQRLSAVTSVQEILAAREDVRKIHVDEALERYAVRLVQATRSDAGVRLAASPRAGLNLVKMARASAYVAGRDFVNPDDIQKVFYPVMEHRVFAKESVPGASHAILSGILSQTSIPR